MRTRLALIALGVVNILAAVSASALYFHTGRRTPPIRNVAASQLVGIPPLTDPQIDGSFEAIRPRVDRVRVYLGPNSRNEFGRQLGVGSIIWTPRESGWYEFRRPPRLIPRDALWLIAPRASNTAITADQGRLIPALAAPRAKVPMPGEDRPGVTLVAVFDDDGPPEICTAWLSEEVARLRAAEPRVDVVGVVGNFERRLATRSARTWIVPLPRFSSSMTWSPG